MKSNFLFVLLFVQSFSFAQEKLENSLLWKVYGKNAKDTTFLYGTIHIIAKKDFILTSRTERALKKSEALVMEVNMNFSKEERQDMAKQAMYPSGKTIKDYLSAEDYKYFESYLTDTLKLGSLKLKIYSMMKPIFVESMIMTEQISDKQSYEETFQKLAKKKPQFGLETISQQMSILNSESVELQVEQMIQHIKEGKLNGVKEMNKLVDLYKNQDLQGLYDYIVQSMTDETDNPEEVKDRMLDNRNQKWIGTLSEMMKDKTLFIAVGAGHLAGEEGVINLLRKEGYKVEPAF